MPSKYTIQTSPAPHRFKSITKSGIIAWEEGCQVCNLCEKSCVYGVYDERGIDIHQMVDSIDNQCMNCFRCVQNCPKELIHKSINPEFKALGDSHWTPDIIAKLWYQAETGKIPVSGAGYPGPFCGDGFDGMWTDMSEIVRPTRDGIHGREYISTAIDLGLTPRSLTLSSSGDLEGETPILIPIPIPIIMRIPAFGSLSRETVGGWAMAAHALGTFLVVPQHVVEKDMAPLMPHLMPEVTTETTGLDKLDGRIRIVEVPWTEEWKKTVGAVRKSHPTALISLRTPLTSGVEAITRSFTEEGVSIIHLEATNRSMAVSEESLSLREGIRAVHETLVEEGIRDGITLLASGGLAMAEHVAKAIICGADGVMVDFPLLIALECHMCRRCTKGLPCPVEIERAPRKWVAARVINMMGAWHNQLLEVMGAMGIRDARRLRGEVGRAMFFEELDRATFSSMGTVGEGYELE